jgi:dethiobiotin synthase
VGRGFFVTGTDTGVGKTLVACALLRAFASGGKSVAGMKPVAAGSEDGRWSDVDAMVQASTVRAPERVMNPYAFEPAVAPHIAADLAGTRIEIEAIARAYTELSRRAEIVVVEGVGGFLVPLNTRETSADLAVRLAAGGPRGRECGSAASIMPFSRSSKSKLAVCASPAGWETASFPTCPIWTEISTLWKIVSKALCWASFRFCPIRTRRRPRGSLPWSL